MDNEPTKKQEFLTFVLLAVFTAPVLSVVLVGTYGFIIWISQILTGPPGV